MELHMEPTDHIAAALQPQSPDAVPVPLRRYRVVIEEHYRTVHLIEAVSQDAAEDAAHNLIGTITAASIAERSDVDITVEASGPA
jgi:hypothetical protein